MSHAPTKFERPPTKLERVLGCLLGGACGDALGAPVEFMSLREIHAQFGPKESVSSRPFAIVLVLSVTTPR
jgi:ADP-ribosylglycohydrolase